MADQKVKYLTRPALVGHRVFLRPATPDDIVNIEYWTIASQPESMSCHIRHFRTPTEAAEHYRSREKTLWELKCAVVRKDDQ
ncbi:MAG: hypothetical protein AB1744_16190, partial [Candidatus Zixiibacteriota bacterium]